MRDKRTRAMWMTLLVCALVGPLVGLLSFTVISFFIEAWGPIDRFEALIPHAQRLSRSTDLIGKRKVFGAPASGFLNAPERVTAN
jgi:hypothetical protein